MRTLAREGFCVELGGRPGPPSRGRGPKTPKVLRKPFILPHFWKSHIFAFKEGFPLSENTHNPYEKFTNQGLSRDRPEPAEGVVGAGRLLFRGGDEGGGKD